MCRWMAYVGSPRLIEEFVYDGKNALCGQAQHSHKAKLGVHGDGGGLGWYGKPPEPGIYRNPGPAWADPNLRELTRMVESRIFFAHVRASTGAPNLFVNCHPFRCKRWMFMHNGQIGGFRQLRRRLDAKLSDDSHAAIQGGTDSELMFHLMITHGLDHDPPSAIRRTMDEIEQMRQADGIDEAFRATLAITNGCKVWAVRWSSDHLAPSLYQKQHENGVLVVSEPLDEDISSWREIAPNSLATVSLDNNDRATARIENFF